MMLRSPVRELIERHRQAVANNDPCAAFGCLITLDPTGHPASRTVTIRRLDENGIAVSVNGNSPKAAQLAADPRYELTLFWPTLLVQYRLRGSYRVSTGAEVERDWQDKGHASKLADLYHATVRPQSSPVASREVFLEEVSALAALHPDPLAMAMPAAVCTITFVPTFIEVWVGSPQDRLHDRRLCEFIDGQWREHTLVP